MSLIFAVPWFLLVGGWQFRNFKAAGSWAVSSLEGWHLVSLKAARIVALREGISREEAEGKLLRDIPEGIPEVELRSLYVKIAIPIIAQHPLELMQTKIEDLKFMMLAPGVESLFRYLGAPTGGGAIGDLVRLSPSAYIGKWFRDKPLEFLLSLFVVGHLFLLYAGSAAAMYGVLKTRKEVLAAHIFLCGIIFYLLMASEGATRMRVPVAPLLSLYGAYGLFFLFMYKRKVFSLNEQRRI